ncbi:MAG: RluA family pseudouridine synthase [Firmicutes bacterium]|nr:RluA family pseudouridine synthase [Bacillota bacterium]
MNSEVLWLKVTYPGPAPVKLATFLRSTVGISVTLLRKLKQAEAIFVNGLPQRVDYLLRPGDTVAIKAIDEEPGLPGEDLPLDIIYEDDYILVVNKPAGMVAHPVKHYHNGTLANALADYLSRGPISRQVRLVHRLDKDTSGLVLVSLNPIVHQKLIAALQTKQIRRIYWALVAGTPPAAGTIDAPIAPDDEVSSRHKVAPHGREAITHFRTLRSWGRKASLVELELETGRTHQIRVHLAHLGHPLLGDSLYGHPTAKDPINRQALHAKQLSFVHPVSGERITLEAPLPADMDRVIRLYDRLAELGLAD